MNLAEDLLSNSEEDTEAAGERLGRALGPDDVVYLTGDLGAGKTAFARGLASGAGALPRQVASPTFAIVNEYAGPGGEVVLRHLDLYRVADTVGELEALGIPGAVAGAPVAVEWPREAIRAILPPTVEVAIEMLDGDRRRIRTRRSRPR